MKYPLKQGLLLTFNFPFTIAITRVNEVSIKTRIATLIELFFLNKSFLHRVNEVSIKTKLLIMSVFYQTFSGNLVFQKNYVYI